MRGTFCTPTFLESSAACAAPPAKHRAHKKSRSLTMVQQNAAQNMSPTPVVSWMLLFGSRIEYTLSPLRREMSALSVYSTFSTPFFWSATMASCPDPPVRWRASSAFTFMAPAPARSKSASRSATLPPGPSRTLRNPCGSTSRNLEPLFISEKTASEISPHRGLAMVQSAPSAPSYGMSSHVCARRSVRSAPSTTIENLVVPESDTEAPLYDMPLSSRYCLGKSGPNRVIMRASNPNWRAKSAQ